MPVAQHAHDAGFSLVELLVVVLVLAVLAGIGIPVFLDARARSADRTAEANVNAVQLAAARLAGILAAKRTGELIPMCHPLLISGVTVDLAPSEAGDGIEIEATVRVTMAVPAGGEGRNATVEFVDGRGL